MRLSALTVIGALTCAGFSSSSLAAELYSVARTKLLARGLHPAPIPRGPTGPCGDNGEKAVCKLYPEAVDCSGMGASAGTCRMAFVDHGGRFFVVSTSGWEHLKRMAFQSGGWANAEDTKGLRNLVSGRREMQDQ